LTQYILHTTKNSESVVSASLVQPLGAICCPTYMMAPTL